MTSTLHSDVRAEWLTYRQAQVISGLGRTTLWLKTTAGEVKAARVGRAVRINRGSLEAYMEREAQGSVQS
jgi:excisionase family DNA binding protein